MGSICKKELAIRMNVKWAVSRCQETGADIEAFITDKVEFVMFQSRHDLPASDV
jgi:hypothetical protein